MSASATETVTFSAALPTRSLLSPRQRHVVLSPRETQVISLIADGLNSREIGEVLFLAESTIREHVKVILAKLRARNRAHAVTIWLHDYAPGGCRRGSARSGSSTRLAALDVTSRDAASLNDAEEASADRL